MREHSPFQHADLEELHTELFSRAERVVPMRDVFKGDTGPLTIGLRHDVDDNPGSFDTALRMAEWECDRGYSATYFLLHGSYYWDEEWLMAAPQFESLGHEVGIHVNAIAEGLRRKRNPHMILADALSELRSTGVTVRGSVAHGDLLCHKARFVNDELFSECRRTDMGAADRLVSYEKVVIPLEQLPLSVYDLEYDANWLSRYEYLSDSGGQWSQPFGNIVHNFGTRGQLHVLIHPDWWSEAFAEVTV